ncbi:hypothetical protein EPN28_02065 [Patescibacteria group bacterium]|nr:MAG: hypothetical protein EPN28_02065 [Patescibacteria group bacterium]
MDENQMGQTPTSAPQPQPTPPPQPPAQPPQPNQAQKNTGMAVVAYLIFFVPLLTDAKNDPFVKYHVKQGLTLFLGWVVTWIIAMIPFIGWVVGWLASIGLLILLILGIMNALGGKQEPLPLLGQYGEKFKF